jgi:DNA gyrase subunit A
VRDLRDGLDATERELLANIGDRWMNSARVARDDDAWDALAGLAQGWRTRYPLVQGRGNFGSVDGDPPADARYTEVRLAPLARELPRFPNLLVNGSGTIPPHNLREVAAALRGAELPGPDFPTGGVLAGDVRALYTSGAAELRLRARAHVEEKAIVVTELPFGVTKGGEDGVIQQIAELFMNRQVTDIRDIWDESDGAGMRFIVVVREDPYETLRSLFALSSLEITIRADLGGLTLPDLLAGYDPDEVDRIAAAYGDERRTALVAGG